MRLRLLCVSLVAGLPLVVPACCGVGPAPVVFTGQTNIVVWDEAHGTEHFIRDARFATKGSSLGFIAPTPTRPHLSDVDRDAFSLLYGLNPLPRTATSETRSGDASPRVNVVEVKDLAGYRATVLKATDASALARWLKTNGYDSPSWLAGWVKPYVRRSWYLTAFKVRAKGTAATGPVRLSFKTDRPFNPYSVPAANSGRASLQLLYVSAGNETPMIGGKRPWLDPSWQAPIPNATRHRLARALRLPADSVPKNAKVSMYSDEIFSRPNQEDLYFVASKPKPTERHGLLYWIGAGLGGSRALGDETDAKRRLAILVAMAAPHAGPVTPEEYLRAERLADRKHELVNGVVYAMSGASVAHVRLVGNLYFHLRGLLSARCEVLMNDMRVAVDQTGLYTYPDLAIVCGEPIFTDSHVDTLLNPLVLIEVLSPSTEAYDRGAKFLHYRTIPSLQAYVLVAQDLALVECFVKNEAGDWILHAALGREQEMLVAPLGVTISLSSVYENVEVPDTISGRKPTPEN